MAESKIHSDGAAGERSRAKNKKRSPGRRILSALGWLFCIVLILYGSLQAMSRTEGFRSLLADRLSDRIGVPLTIGGSRLDWALNIYLERLSSGPEDKMENAPGVRVDHVDVCWRWPRGGRGGVIRSLRVDGARISLVQADNGTWSPSGLAPLAEKITRLGQLGMLSGMMSEDTPGAENGAGDTERSSAEEEDREADNPLNRMNVVIQHADVVWWSHARKLASITDLDFLSRSVEFPERQVQYYRVSAEEAAVAGGRSVQNLSFEMISTAGRNIVLGPTASWRNGAAQEEEPAQIPEETLVSREEELLAHAESVIQRTREEHPAPAAPERLRPTPVPTVQEPLAAAIPTAVPTVVRTPTPRPLPTPTPTPVPTPVPVPTAEPRSEPMPASIAPDPMKQALESFATAQKMTNTGSAASEGLSDDESEALIKYIKDMLESGE